MTKKAVKEIIKWINSEKKVTIDVSHYKLNELKDILASMYQQDIEITLVNCNVFPMVALRELTVDANSSIANVIMKTT